MRTIRATPMPPEGRLTEARLSAARRRLGSLGGVHEATLRVNVRWVTPLGEDTASMS